MNTPLSELLEVPVRAQALLAAQVPALPLGVPYLGMGSSYFAPLAFKYMGVNIQPEIASEYYHYLSKGEKKPMAVLLSQSGRSSEVLWCQQLFDHYTALTNYPENELGIQAATVIALLAGEEHFSSSKTYVNTLLALFKGFGMDPSGAVMLLSDRMPAYEQMGKRMAEELFELINRERIHGIYITGSGPNLATALEAALIMSESTRLNFHGLAMAQYDHGPKETARNSIVIQIMAQGKSYERSLTLGDTVARAGAHVFRVEEPGLDEHFSILANILPFNFMACHLSELMGIKETFSVGGKVTEVL
jgi:glucosamine--fructose-6-phosphate aminotransferase (isomerizing)